MFLAGVVIIIGVSRTDLVIVTLVNIVIGAPARNTIYFLLRRGVGYLIVGR